MRSTTCSWSSFWTTRRKIPDLWGKFPLFKPPMIWYNRGELWRPGSPPRCIQAFFILTFGYTGCRISMWFAGLPAAFRGWKLEAVKQAGDNPPAEMVQVITGSVCIAFLRLSPLPKQRLSCIIARYAENKGRLPPIFLRGMNTNECIQRKESPPGDSLPGGLR